MTILYKPVKIESAAQAETLPIGTVAVHYPRHGMEDQAAVRVRGGWEFTGTNPDTFDHLEAVGMEALVSIEAEEEWGVVLDAEGSADLLRDEDEARAWAYSVEAHPSRRLVTPWEEV